MAERSMISALAVHEYDFVKAKKAKGGQWRWLSGPPDAPLGRLRLTTARTKEPIEMEALLHPDATQGPPLEPLVRAALRRHALQWLLQDNRCARLATEVCKLLLEPRRCPVPTTSSSCSHGAVKRHNGAEQANSSESRSICGTGRTTPRDAEVRSRSASGDRPEQDISTHSRGERESWRPGSRAGLFGYPTGASATQPPVSEAPSCLTHGLYHCGLERRDKVSSFPFILAASDTTVEAAIRCTLASVRCPRGCRRPDGRMRHPTIGSECSCVALHKKTEENQVEPENFACGLEVGQRVCPGLGWGSDITDSRVQEALKGCVTGYHGTGSMVGALKRLNDTGAHAAPDHIVLDDMPADRFLNQINLRMSEFSVKLADAVKLGGLKAYAPEFIPAAKKIQQASLTTGEDGKGAAATQPGLVATVELACRRALQQSFDRLVLVGSAALRVETPGSDVDVVCFTRPGYREALGLPVDVLRRVHWSLSEFINQFADFPMYFSMEPACSVQVQGMRTCPEYGSHDIAQARYTVLVQSHGKCFQRPCARRRLDFDEAPPNCRQKMWGGGQWDQGWSGGGWDQWGGGGHWGWGNGNNWNGNWGGGKGHGDLI
eukprot:s3458_g2.t1